MKPYPSYVPAPEPSLRQIPTHWQMKRLKNVLSLSYGDSLAADVRVDGPVSVYGSNGQVGTHIEANTQAPVIIVGRKGSYGKLNFSNDPVFCIDTAYHVAQPMCDADLRFMFYAMQPLGLHTMSQDTGVPGLSREIAYRQLLPIPPFEEQLAIAAYLDVEIARIDALSAEKRNLLGYLADLKTTRISELLTGVHTATVETGDPWLPKLPEGWALKRLKYLGQVRSGLAKGKKHEANAATVELPYMRVANVQDGHIDLTDVSLMEVAEEEVERFSLIAGDVLMNEGGDYDKLGRGAVWQGEIAPCLHQNHVFAARLDDVEWAPWVAAITRTAYAKFYFMNNSKQSTNLASISQTNIKELPVAMPPASQRDAILLGLATELNRIDALVDHAEQELKLLAELRASTIIDAVLGRIDVRSQPSDETQPRRAAA